MLVCLAALTVTAFTLGKYVHQMRERAVGVATDFFFRSDYLAETGSRSFDVYGGTIEFKLFNHDGVNETDRNITYQITVQDAEENEITDFTVTGNAGLAGRAKSENGIVISGLAAGTYTVTATSTVPYRKSLSAIFEVHDMDGSTFYSVEDVSTGEYIILHVFTGNSGTIAVSYGGDLAADNTDARMNGWTSGAVNTWSGSPNAHYEFIFFENTPDNDYTKSQTKVTGNSITITAQ